MSIPKFSFNVWMTAFGPPVSYAALIWFFPGRFGTSTMRSRGKLTTNVFWGPGSTWATMSVSDRWPLVLGSFGLPNAAMSPGSVAKARVSDPMIR